MRLRIEEDEREHLCSGAGVGVGFAWALPMSGYVELHARSAFSFLRGASLPETLAEVAVDCGHVSMALCDRMGVYGAPRFYGTAKEVGLRAVIGAELVMEDESVLPVLVGSRVGYQNLCGMLTRAHLRAEKGAGRILWDELGEFAEGLVALTGDEDGPVVRALRCRTGMTPEDVVQRLIRSFGADQLYMEIQRHRCRGEERRVKALMDLAGATGVRTLATHGVLHARPEDREVLDVFTCLREHTRLDTAGASLLPNSERHLKTAAEMYELFRDVPGVVEESVRLAERLEFTLADLGYAFPEYPVGADETMGTVLREWTFTGARQRYPGGIPSRVKALLEKELALIQKLSFEGYFLIVADIVRYCKTEGIMAQGRGSAANSAVCFCLGITAVDPVRFNVLFERFLSESRKSWPDIDIDLPSGDRREQVIQEMYRRHGKHGAAMTATVIRYRGRSTARELGKVLDLPEDVIERFSNLFASGDHPHTLELMDQVERAGLPANHPRTESFLRLYGKLGRLPRHLGQHSGGMILCRGALSRVMPLENASMPGRVVAQWDKDDCEDLGIIKVDLLGLGMMSVLQETITLAEERGRPVDLAQLPEQDAETFDLLQRADTIGVFQVESRAQMATLPRMKPRCFYDVVIEVAIIRPGPIQGDLAHPYLRRRDGLEPVSYYDERLRPVLERTLGVPLFQEQMLQMAMVMANFTGDEAEELRKALSFHRSEERMQRASRRLESALAAAGVSDDVSARIVKAVGSFALYGFPESHAISFALLAYASAWLKVHRASEFYCALLNNQPMGFYSSATLVKDARRHGVPIRPVCVVESRRDCVVESDGGVRLGLRLVQGLRRESVEHLLRERDRVPFQSMADFRKRTRWADNEIRQLASIGALNRLAAHRRAALWEVEREIPEDDLFETFGMEAPPLEVPHDSQNRNPDVGRTASPLMPMRPEERVAADYAGLRLTTGPHPMALFRDRLPDVWTASDLLQVKNQTRVRVAGQVICRQRPGTAKGVCFVSLEDETGIVNVVIDPVLFEKERLTISSEPFLLIEGIAGVRHDVVHIRAIMIERLDQAPLVTARSHDFH